MKLPKSMTTVTPLSKFIALSMFILFPVIAFYFGMKYQQAVDISSEQAVIPLKSDFPKVPNQQIITPTDITLPTVIPISGIPLQVNQTLINNNSQTLDEKIAECKGIKNGSNLSVSETSRIFFYLPKDIYPNKDANLHSFTVSGNASAGYISSAGPPGEAYGITQDCWSYYDEFDGEGVVNLTAPSAIKGYTDYHITVTVTKT